MCEGFIQILLSEHCSWLQFWENNPLSWKHQVLLVHMSSVNSLLHRNLYNGWRQWSLIHSLASRKNHYGSRVIKNLEYPSFLLDNFQIWWGPGTYPKKSIYYDHNEHHKIQMQMWTYQFKKKYRALWAASLSCVELLMGSYHTAFITIPILPFCFPWKPLNIDYNLYK